MFQYFTSAVRTIHNIGWLRWLNMATTVITAFLFEKFACFKFNNNINFPQTVQLLFLECIEHIFSFYIGMSLVKISVIMFEVTCRTHRPNSIMYRSTVARKFNYLVAFPINEEFHITSVYIYYVK